MLKDLDVDVLEYVFKLMAKHGIDSLEIEGLKISKKLHFGTKKPKQLDFKAPPVNFSTSTDNEAMFFSSSAPKLNLEDYANYAATVQPMKDK